MQLEEKNLKYMTLSLSIYLSIHLSIHVSIVLYTQFFITVANTLF